MANLTKYAKQGAAAGTHLPANRLFLLVITTMLAGCTVGCGPRGVTATFSDGTVSLGPDWVSIPASTPMTTKWDRQIVFLEVNSTFNVSYRPQGFRLEDGTIAVPELEAVSTDGRRWPFRLEGLIKGEQIQFSSDTVPRGTTFSQVRVRSPIPLVCSQVSWLSYMPQDVKDRFKVP